MGVMQDLIGDGNSIVLVDHDTRVLSTCDWLIEMGPGAGSKEVASSERGLWLIRQSVTLQDWPFPSKRAVTT